MKTIVLIVEYPETFTFTTDNKLPLFKYASPPRQKLLLNEMVGQDIISPVHGYGDYVIEQIRTIPIDKHTQVEIWVLGS